MLRQMADAESGLGLPLPTLAWALCFGACLGGNGSLIGASANIVTQAIANHHNHPITFVGFMKVSFPTMILSCIIASAYMLIRYGT